MSLDKDKHLARESHDTPLAEWLIKHRCSLCKFAKAAGLNRVSLTYVARNQTLPTLITALRIEDATGGDVKPADWLKTPLAKIRLRGRNG